MPTRAAMTPKLVSPELLAPAAALNQVMWNGAGVVGPAVGGIVVAALGLSWAYGIDVARTCVAIGVRADVARRNCPSAIPTTEWRGRVGGGARRLPVPQGPQRAPVDVHDRRRRDGVRHAARVVPGARRDAVPPRAGGRRAGCSARSAFGALVGALTSGWVGARPPPGPGDHPRRRAVGRARSPRSGWWATDLWLALGCLALAGGADVISRRVPRRSSRRRFPDDLRGRLAAFNIFVVAGGPRLGDFEGGIVAVDLHARGLGRVRRIVVPRRRRRDRGGGAALRALACRRLRPD